MRRLHQEQILDHHLHVPEPWLSRYITYAYEEYIFNLFIPTDYPFHPPKIICGKTDHIGYFSNRRTFFKSVIDTYFPTFPCMCCSSITQRWSPSITIRQIIVEYIEFQMKMRTVMNTYLLQSRLEIPELWRHIVSFL
jgi:hypothetical protein